MDIAKVTTDKARQKALLKELHDIVDRPIRLMVACGADHSGASKRAVLKIIEKYTGDSPLQHCWNFVKGERGKQIYSAL
ncbi:MAG: hypothetical protein KKB91_08390 [Proteobacteria bacterium]|jgi:hypothetical protein|nr:hypothetical protein [Desulfocapsa sp.]MBU3945561.1 hypothetical protein [Pseudomonadota bacterium]MCG2742978.1 hypothetical protein [Desulfobacteraceae bacterium]MBU4030412.1 hypothetical protein [Pseudomonadota bacterium]MBU4042947.1 hypothetical protein [Pseudomonadota bacterium]